MIEQQPIRNSTKYLSAVLIIGGWLGGSLVQYGIMKTTEGDLDRRVATLEQELREDSVPRKEYETWQKDIRDRLEAIENKLDRNFRSGGKQ
jgi:hypothetical protein